MDLVSIIVPVYMVEKYLERCVDSLRCQSYDNIEIILINDGSLDSSPSMCDEYAEKDKRIKVIHKKNGGLSDARNVGIQASTGEYLVFVDSDDWVHKNFIEALISTAIETDADISACSYQATSDDVEADFGKKNASVAKEFSSVDAIKDIFSAKTRLWVMTWNKLYKKTLFTKNNIYFPVGRIHEDNFTTYKLFFYANKVVFIDQQLYYYFQREDSIMGKSFDHRRYAIFEALDETHRFIQHHKLPVENDFVNYRLMMTLAVLDSSMTGGSNGKIYQADLKKKARVLCLPSLCNPATKMYHKAMVLMASVSPEVYHFCKVFIRRVTGGVRWVK